MASGLLEWLETHATVHKELLAPSKSSSFAWYEKHIRLKLRWKLNGCHQDFSSLMDVDRIKWSGLQSEIFVCSVDNLPDFRALSSVLTDPFLCTIHSIQVRSLECVALWLDTDFPPRSVSGGWVKVCLGLLHRRKAPDYGRCQQTNSKRMRWRVERGKLASRRGRLMRLLLSNPALLSEDSFLFF